MPIRIDDDLQVRIPACSFGGETCAFEFSPILAQMFHKTEVWTATKIPPYKEYKFDEFWFYLKLDISTSNETYYLDDVSFYLSYNYFPNVSTLIENLNKLTVEHVNNMLEHVDDMIARERK